METQEQQTPSKSINTHKKSKKHKSSKLETLIKVIDEDKGKCPPIVGYFPSGVDPITYNHSDNPPLITTLRNKKHPKRLEIVVKPHGSKVDYVGNNHSGEAASGTMGVSRLALVDKLNRTITFIPIASSKVFRLEPKVRKLEESIEEPATPATTERTYEERKQIMNRMIDTFGTSAAVKQAKKKEQLRQLDDPESRQEMDQILQQTEVDKEAIENANTNTKRNIPPHNLTATTPQTTYPLNKIILSGELDYLNDILHLLQAGEELNSDSYPSFVRNRSHKVVLLQDEEEKKKVAGILSYITHLINFKNKNSLEGFASSKHHKIPTMLLQKFSKMFLDPVKKKISDDKIEAILSYILVLTLHVDEFESDFIDIAKDLKMSPLSVRPYFLNLGCKFRSRNKVTIAYLPVPLKFEPVRRKRGRG